MALQAVFLAVVCGHSSSTQAPAPARHTHKPLNVLMIGVDDLRPSGSAFNVPELLLPNLDRLAARSTVFTNAFVQAATCGVSRSSLLTSRRPDTNYVTGNGACPFSTDPRHKAWQSLPEYFRSSNYQTAGAGKIFHPNICEGAAVGERSAAWSEPYYHAPCISLGSIYNGTCYESDPGPLPEGPGGKVTSVYANSTRGSGDDMPDAMIATHAIAMLERFRARRTKAAAAAATEQEKKEGLAPFFLAVGFHKPHLPHIAPQEFFDLYPLDKVSLPPNASRYPPANAPAIAWNGCGEWKSYKDVNNFTKAEGFGEGRPVDDLTTRSQRQAYFAAASFTDSLVGKLLAALKTFSFEKSTVVAMWGDHGWHLGENNEWAKHTAMTHANRAPLLLAHPGGSHATSAGYVEFVDIYPSLAELAGIDVPRTCATEEESQTMINCTEGRSLADIVMKKGQFEGKVASFSQWPKGGKMGYIIFTKSLSGSDVRYTEWVGYKNHTPQWGDDTAGKELYNRTADPDENINIVADPALAAEVARLSAVLHAGWRAVTQ